jgi:tetratricopeptide (TPR) repeat protein
MPPIEGLVAERLLGAGGFGQVYLARVANGGGRVAVKVPNNDADAIMRLELEGETLRLLGGVHAPALYDRPLLDDGRPALVMEFVPMPTLADRLAELPDGMPLDELGRRALSILAGLKAVHELGLVHRDLKPENIFSTDGPPVTRIFDFGLVKTPAMDNEPHTTMGLMMGTPEYMAPEQLDSSAPVDQRADLYAIGAVLYEMLAGRPPFWGNAAEVQQALAARRAPRPSRYVAAAPPAVEDVILRCLAKDPSRRYATTEELHVAFAAALTQAVPVVSAAPVPAPDAKPAAAGPQRRPMAVLAVNGIAVDVLSKALAAGGGQLAEVGRNGGVGVFGEKTSENPVRRAIRLADSLLARKACRNAVVDLAQVVVRKKPDGSERYVSATFARLQKQLETLTVGGLFLTDAAGELLPERRGEPLPEGGTAALAPPREEEALTVVRSSQAPLVGRSEELGRLTASLRAAIAERRAGLATLIADGGMGKSHLGAALIEELRASRTDATIVELRIREPIEGEGESNLRALLGRCFNLPAERPADSGAALLAGLGPSLWPVAAMTLGWLAPDGPELRALSAAPGVLRAMVSRSVGEALRLRARERPLAVILDDAHLGDDATLEAIEYATMREAGAPVWICVAARPALAQAKPSWGERSADHLRVELGPLAPDAATELARRLLYPVEHIAASALETLVAGTQGNPFLLTELVRGLKRDGIVRRDPNNGVWFLATDELAKLPDLAVTDWLAEREIGTLTPELAEHARLSALLGSDFSEDEVDGILSEMERAQVGIGVGQTDGGDASALKLDPHVATRQLVAMGVFKRQRGGRTAFRHSLLRSAVEKSVSDRLRASVHAAAFRFYQAASGLEESVRLPRLAFHAASAGHADEAAKLYLELAARARSRHAYVEAEALYSRALGQLPESALAPRALALRGRGFMRYRMSRHDAVDDLMAALAAARALVDRKSEIEIILEAATAYDWMVEYRKSRELVSEADALFAAGAPDSPLLRASLLVGQGRALWRFSEGKPAIEKFRQAIALAEGLGDEGYEIRVISLLLLGDLLPYHGEVAEAEKVFETVVSLCEGHGDQAHLMVAFLNRRQLWIGKRELERALEDSRRSIQLAREIGFVAASFMGEYNLGELLYQAGDADAAATHVRRAVDLEQKRLSGFHRPVARLLEARVLTFLGRNAEARAIYEEITAAQAEAEKAGQTEKVLLPSERVLLTLVDLSTRDASWDEWKALRARADADSVEQELIEVVEMSGLAALRAGLDDVGRAQLAEARRLADRIPNVMGNRLSRHDAQPIARVS